MRFLQGWSLRRKLAFAAMGLVVGVLATVITLNFVGPERRIQHRLEHRHGVADPAFLREFGSLLGPQIMAGNRIAALQNGVEIFPAMLEAIRGAERSVTFESFIYWSGKVGEQFAAALSDRARAGVKVHLLIDWLGSQKIDEAMIDSMQQAGVEVRQYRALEWYHLSRINNRTHRKLLIVDGRIGFTGGVGIADPWDGDATQPKQWRDSHYRLEGPAVGQLQSAFVDNWTRVTGFVLRGDEYFPQLTPVGGVAAQIFTSSPTGGADSMALMYLLAIAAAERSIDLSAAYFLPDGATRLALIDARRRGVRVRVIVPGDLNDSEVIKGASRENWGQLLAVGVELHEFQGAMFHCKGMVVDGLLVSVGSTNFDNRSFRLNAEANLNAYDAELAAQVTTVFERDLARSKLVTIADWSNRPWHERALGWIGGLFESQL